MKKKNKKFTPKIVPNAPYFVMTNGLYDSLVIAALTDLEVILNVDEKRDPEEVQQRLLGAAQGFACFKDIVQVYME